MTTRKDAAKALKTKVKNKDTLTKDEQAVLFDALIDFIGEHK